MNRFAKKAILAIWLAGCSHAVSAQPQTADPGVRPTGHRTPVGKLVNSWWEARRAAGNVGDWYDNRDRGHSELQIGTFHPQLSKVTYTDDEKAKRLDWAAQGRLLRFVTLGNSSTSAPPERGGSNPRHYYVSPQGLRFLYAQYRVNNLYVYPEHRDYDPGHNQRPGYGDLYPTNTPYLVISQGSSGSDRAFLSGLAYTMAAFQPEVKTTLVKHGLLVPTLQYILRRCYRTVVTDEDYLTRKAHPTVFDGSQLDPMQMVQLAQSMTVDTIPPLVQLEVVEEEFADAVANEPSEKLGDTPDVIARIHRGPELTKRIVVSARKSQALNGGPLEYRWVLLRGDPGRVDMAVTEEGSVAELRVAYHDRMAAGPYSPIESNRVDIGVFACQGKTWSAPAFVTIFYLDNELRTYDDQGHPQDIYRAAGDMVIGYATSDSVALVNDRYDIYDWPALFAKLQSDEDSLGTRLLRHHFTPEQLQAIHRAAARFDMAPLAALNAVGKPTKEQRDEQTRIRNELARILLDPDTALGENVKICVERALNTICSDRQLFLDHAVEIRQLAEQCAERKSKAAVEGAIQKLEASGILSNGSWRSTIPGNTVLTHYEVYQIERLNLAIMNHLLFPEFLRRVERVNYVDPRLTTPQPYRDIYRCDPSGKVLDRERFDDGKPGQYLPVKTTKS